MQQSRDEVAHLLHLTAQGDRAAFRRLYDCTAPRQMAIALRILRRRDLAEEAVQDAYVSIWQRAGTFRPGIGSGQGWITTILRRRAIDRLRASPWLSREIAADLPDGEPIHADTEERLTLLHCLERLAENVRVAIRLAYLHGLTHQELSTKLDMPLGSLKSRLRRGLIALKECLET